MFPKAQIKRFNETVGCAPPPGSYDPKIKEKPSGGVVDKSDRFKDPKVKDGAANTSTISSTGNTPVKQLFAAPQPVKSARKPSKSTPSAESSKIKDLERELKSLFKEKKDKDQLVTQKEEELKKLDSRLHLSQTDKSALQAKLASAQKELLEVKKANNLLKSKDSSSDAAHKKLSEVQTDISTLKQQLTQKDVEIAKLKKEVDTVLAALLANLHIIEATTVSLEQFVQNHDKNIPSNTQKGDSAEEFEKKLGNTKLIDAKIKLIKKRAQELNGRFNEGLTGLSVVTVSLRDQYQSVNTSLEELKTRLEHTTAELQQAIDTSKTLEKHRNELLGSNEQLEGQVKHLTEEHRTALEQNNSTAEKIHELERSKSALESQFQDLQDVREAVEREHSEKLLAMHDKETVFYERMVELKAENEDFAAALQETGELLSKTKEENMTLEEALIQAQRCWEFEKKEFLGQAENLFFEKSKLEGDLVDTEKKVEILNNDLEEQKKTAESRISDLQSQLDREKDELLQLQNKLGDLVFEKSQLHTEIGHLEAQLKLVKSESDQMKSEADKALMAVPSLQDKIETLKQAKDEADKRVDELREENVSLQKTLEVFQSDMDHYSISVEEDKQEAQDKILRLTDEIEGLKEQKDQMAKELDDWLTDKSELDIEVAKLQCRIKVVEMDCNQQQEEADAALREQRDIVDKVTAEKKQMEKDMEQYGIDLLSHAATIQSLQAQIQSKTSECEKAEQTVVTLQGDLSEAAEKHTELEKTVAELTDNYTSKCTECEELIDTNDKLTEDLSSQREAYEDIECRLEQTRADFIKRCNERDGLKETNQVKDKSLAVLSQQVAQLNLQLQETNDTLQSKCTECTELIEKCGEHEKSLVISVQQNANYKQQIEDYKEHLQLKCEECDDLRQRFDDLDTELTLSAKEMVDMQEKIESLQRYNVFLYDKLVNVTYTGYQLKEKIPRRFREKQAAEEKVSILDEYETELDSLREQVATSSGSEEIEAELNRYRTLYEELQAKVEPFMEQIDAFELEKKTLMGMNKNTQADLERLANDYAQLLGHQNHKQKIKLMVRMKDENYALKKENTSLKSEVAKQKRSLQKLQEKEAPSRFDPTKAFKHSRENLNVTQVKSPLKEVNRK